MVKELLLSLPYLTTTAKFLVVGETCYSYINDCQSFKGLAVMHKSKNNKFKTLPQFFQPQIQYSFIVVTRKKYSASLEIAHCDKKINVVSWRA